MKDCMIIGSGPAGLSAAVYAVRAGLDTAVIEKAPMSGGQILNTYEVDNYLGMPGINGFDMGMQFRAHADKLGAEFIEDEICRIEKTAEGFKLQGRSAEYESRTVILAMGATHAKLGVPGEELPGVSYCATCDGAFYRKKTTVVVGGGDVALEDAIYLAALCEKVYVLHRRGEFRGAKILQDRLAALPNVELMMNCVAEAIRGDERVQAVACKNINSGETFDLPVNGVFIAVGIHPATEAVTGLLPTENGYLTAGEDCRTEVPGLFAAGDIRKKPLRQIVTAVADGANAAISASEYLK